jgi:5-methylcytosine-specific restriction protein A
MFVIEVSEDHIKKERVKAQEIRKSSWWKKKRSSGKCYYCNRIFNPKDLTIDHIVPIVRGGRSTKSNIVPACKECNSKKKYLLPIEWEEYLDSLNG